MYYLIHATDYPDAPTPYGPRLYAHHTTQKKPLHNCNWSWVLLEGVEEKPRAASISIGRSNGGAGVALGAAHRGRGKR